MVVLQCNGFKSILFMDIPFFQILTTWLKINHLICHISFNQHRQFYSNIFSKLTIGQVRVIHYHFHANRKYLFCENLKPTPQPYSTHNYFACCTFKQKRFDFIIFSPHLLLRCFIRDKGFKISIDLDLNDLKWPKTIKIVK